MKLREYRLNSQEEPTDEMLHEIMRQVAEDARQSSRNAKLALEKRFQELQSRISARMALKGQVNA